MQRDKDKAELPSWAVEAVDSEEDLESLKIAIKGLEDTAHAIQNTIIPGEALADEPPEEVPFVVEPLIPAGGTTALVGPPGIGKTGLDLALGNAMALGEKFLGLPTQRGRALFISLDMNKAVCKIRLDRTGFRPAPGFDFAYPHPEEPVDCLSPAFKQTRLYKGVRGMLRLQPYDLIMIDALGRLRNLSMK